MSLQSTLVSRNLRNASGGVRRTSKLDSALVALQEKLYRQIASELHDSTCQHLIAASLGVMQMKNALRDPRKAEEHCEQVDLSINRALKELRSLTYLLHPQSVFEGGLKTTIERYAEGFGARTSLVVEVSISSAVDSLSREKQRSLMRIVQEALTNVYRHAKATRVDITIAAGGRAFQLEIRDDGQGMKGGNRLCRLRQPALGTGLRIMHDRLAEMGGRLEILSAPTAARRGTTLRATFPYAFAIEQNGRRCALKKGC
jgi:two-component system, NarL family, sensor kinase